MKRRGIKDTIGNRQVLLNLGFGFTVCERRKRVFIKISNSDLAIVKELLPEPAKTNNSCNRQHRKTNDDRQVQTVR